MSFTPGVMNRNATTDGSFTQTNLETTGSQRRSLSNPGAEDRAHGAIDSVQEHSSPAESSKEVLALQSLSRGCASITIIPVDLYPPTPRGYSPDLESACHIESMQMCRDHQDVV